MRSLQTPPNGVDPDAVLLGEFECGGAAESCLVDGVVVVGGEFAWVDAQWDAGSSEGEVHGAGELRTLNRLTTPFLPSFSRNRKRDKDKVLSD